MKKALFRLFSAGIMLLIFAVPFVDSELIKNIYKVNEVIHWVQIPLVIILGTSILQYKRSEKAQTPETKKAMKKTLKNLKESKNNIFAKAIRALDYPALVFILFYLGDMSFGIALAMCMVFERSIHKSI